MAEFSGDQLPALILPLIARPHPTSSPRFTTTSPASSASSLPSKSMVLGEISILYVLGLNLRGREQMKHQISIKLSGSVNLLRVNRRAEGRNPITHHSQLKLCVANLIRYKIKAVPGWSSLRTVDCSQLLQRTDVWRRRMRPSEQDWKELRIE